MPAPASEVRFDLVVATVDRTDDLARLLASLAAQEHRAFRVLVVDQNEDDRVEPLLARHPELDVVHLRSARGLSRARNAALPRLEAEIVGFPDDDCSYSPTLLARVADRFRADPALDGLSGRPESQDGRVVGRWPDTSTEITPDSVWHTANSHTMFLRRELVERVGSFDEALGLGSGTPFSSGEETDYLVRALRGGARLAYDPSLVITHPVKQLSPDGLATLGAREGGSVGYILARNGYPLRTVARMLVRPLVGARPRPRPARRETRAVPGGDARRAACAGSGRGHALGNERREERRVALEPVAEREALDRPRARRGGVALAVGQHGRDGRGELPGARVARRARSRRGAARRRRPRRRRARRCRRSPRTTTGSPQAIASITVVGHGSLTFVWRRTCARWSTAGAASCA